LFILAEYIEEIGAKGKFKVSHDTHDTIDIINHDTDLRIWGMSPSQRSRKILQKYEQRDGHIVILRGDAVYDEAVLRDLCQKDILLADAHGVPLAATVPADMAEAARFWLLGQGDAPHNVPLARPEECGDAYRDQLRKKEDPFALIVTADNIRAVEWRLYQGSYKGVTDIVTKYVWPVPAFHVTRLCAAARLSPNMVTTVGAILMFAALWLFWQGHFGWGLLAGWIMTFLDTVDGKLARVTLTSSPFGNIFDHGIDLVHPPFWYIAWGFGLGVAGHALPDGWLAPVLWAMFAFYVLGRLCEGYFIARYGCHLHVWRRFDSVFRLISSRRNPNMIVLTFCWVLAVPDIGLLIITAWGGATFVMHLVQIAQAEWCRVRGRPVTSWMLEKNG